MRKAPASPAAARRHRKVLARAYRARLLSPSPSPVARRPASSDAAPRPKPQGNPEGSPPELPPAPDEDDARVANLMRRFEGVRCEEVREALDSANGHAGRAATKLRAILDRAALSPRSLKERPAAAKRTEARPAAVTASPGTPSGPGHASRGEEFSAGPSPRTAVQLTTGKPLALQRVGVDDEAMVLVRKLRTLCDCGHGSVQEVVSRSGQRYALKVTERENTGRHWTDAVRETKAMTDLNGHPLLVTMIGTRKDPNQVYALLELCTGGDLCTRLAETERLDEHATQFYGAQMSQALQYMHTPRCGRDEESPMVHYIHRDIKPDNVFIAANGYLKLGDFGFTSALQDGERRHTKCGTSEYMAPEVVRHGGYGRSADYWSLGVMLYECICGATPFAGYDDDTVYGKILKFSESDLTWIESAPSPRAKERMAKAGFGLSAAVAAATAAGLPEVDIGITGPKTTTAACRDFITKLMQVDIEQRLGMGDDGVEELTRHRWFSRIDWKKMDRQEIVPPWVPPEVGHVQAF